MLVFYSSTITIMYVPINIRLEVVIFTVLQTLLGPSSQGGWIQLGIVVSCEWER